MTPSGRDAGVSFAVGWFLLALGCGALIPRSGRGIFQLITDSACPTCWKTSFLACGAWLIVSSYTSSRWARLSAALLGLICWVAVAILFVKAQLWGATVQATAAIILLNSCIFHSLHGGE